MLPLLLLLTRQKDNNPSNLISHRAMKHRPIQWCLVLGLVGIGLSCQGRTTSPPCTMPEGLLIRWGSWYDSLGILRGYQLDREGRVVEYEQTVKNGQIRLLDTLAVHIEPKTHCDVALSLKNAFLHNQAYVVIGPVSHYVEYTTPTATLRAVWDSRFETYGSRHFRAIFRWLNYLIGRHETADR